MCLWNNSTVSFDEWVFEKSTVNGYLKTFYNTLLYLALLKQDQAIFIINIDKKKWCDSKEFIKQGI